MKRLLFTIPIVIVIMMLFGLTAKAQLDWNTLGNNAATGNFLGTINPEPLRVRTDNVQRMHINQSKTTSISAFNNIVTDGYVGIGPDIPSGLWNGTGPFSLLHLNGGNFGVVNPSGTALG